MRTQSCNLGSTVAKGLVEFFKFKLGSNGANVRDHPNALVHLGCRQGSIRQRSNLEPTCKHWQLPVSASEHVSSASISCWFRYEDAAVMVRIKKYLTWQDLINEQWKHHEVADPLHGNSSASTRSQCSGRCVWRQKYTPNKTCAKNTTTTPEPHQNHTFPPCEEPSWQNQMAVRWSWGLPRKLKPEASARSSEAASQQVQRNLKDLESHLSSAVSKANCVKIDRERLNLRTLQWYEVEKARNGQKTTPFPLNQRIRYGLIIWHH